MAQNSKNTQTTDEARTVYNRDTGIPRISILSERPSTYHALTHPIPMLYYSMSEEGSHVQALWLPWTVSTRKCKKGSKKRLSWA